MDDRSFTIITVAILILSPILLYMNGDDDETVNNYDTSSGLVPVWERANQNFNTTGSYSYTLESGDFESSISSSRSVSSLSIKSAFKLLISCFNEFISSFSLSLKFSSICDN